MWIPDEFWRVLREKGQEQGVTGFSGQCGQLAFCAKEYLYPDAEIIGAFNKTLYDMGTLYGHVFLYKNGTYFDAKNASRNIDPFLPLTRIGYKDKRVNPQNIKPNRFVKQRGDSLVIVRHMNRKDAQGLAKQFAWVCNIFRK